MSIKKIQEPLEFISVLFNLEKFRAKNGEVEIVCLSFAEYSQNAVITLKVDKLYNCICYY